MTDLRIEKKEKESVRALITSIHQHYEDEGTMNEGKNCI